MLGNKEIMAKNIKHYLELKGKTRQDICKALGFSYSTFADWCNAKKYPRIDKIEMMANYFGISKADLVEDHAEEDELSKYMADPEIRRLVLFAGGQLPRDAESRRKLVDAIIFTIGTMRNMEGGNG